MIGKAEIIPKYNRMARVGGTPENLLRGPKGVAHNPKGKPKGHRAFKVIMREALAAQAGKGYIAALKARGIEPLGRDYDAVFAAGLIGAAIRIDKDGELQVNVMALREALDRRDGKPAQAVELTGRDGEAIPIRYEPLPETFKE